MILLYDGCYLKLKIYLLYFLILRSIYICKKNYVKKKETRVNSMVDRIRGGQVVVLSEI